MNTTFKQAARMAGASLLFLTIAACEKADEPTVSAAQALAEPAAPTLQRKKDFAQIARGSKTFAQNCVVCHGDKAIGAPNWRIRNTDGSFPPPALNGTAHAWHHPMSFLKDIIVNGSPQGGAMPPWKDTLSDQEIEDVIAYFQSLWPNEVYQPWSEADQRARSQAGTG